jgi:hypothetical protein
VTSLERATKRRIELPDVEAGLIRHFAGVFEREVVTAVSPG